ncbi:MAG: lysostaphin resistance A-like protein [Phycisphaerae bacterium]
MSRTDLLQLADWILIGAGTLLGLLWVLPYLRRRRDPLRPARSRPIRLDGPQLVLILLGWMIATQAGAWAALPLIRALFSLPDRQHADLLAAATSTAAAQLVVTPACLLIAALAFHQGLRGLGIGRRPVLVSLAWGTGGFLASWPPCLGLLRLSSALLERIWPGYEPQAHPVLQALHLPALPASAAAWLYVGAICVAPVAEEVFFRGLLQSGLVRLSRSRWLAICSTAIVFGLIHRGQPQAILPLTMLGLTLGLIYEKTGSLTAVIILHSLFNAKNLLWDALSATAG